MLTAIIFIIGGYILGSIPFAIVIGKGIYHVDVRESGSGNIGTTNVFRVIGKKAGILVYICDTCKGFLPVFLAARLTGGGSAALVAVLTAGAAIAGHTWPVWLRGKGGKGVAVGGGSIIALMPVLFVVAFAIFWVVLVAGRMVSVASVAAAVGFGAAALITGQPMPYIIFALLGAAVIIYAHRANFKRLRRGSENRVTFPWNKKAAGTDGGPGGKDRTAGGGKGELAG